MKWVISLWAERTLFLARENYLPLRGTKTGENITATGPRLVVAPAASSGYNAHILHKPIYRRPLRTGMPICLYDLFKSATLF